MLNFLFVSFTWQAVLKKAKWKIKEFFQDDVSCCLPLDPAIRVKALDVEVGATQQALVLFHSGFSVCLSEVKKKKISPQACKVYNSNAAPLGISFSCSDPLARNVSIICKVGGD